jgi:hypothetical protein
MGRDCVGCVSDAGLKNRWRGVCGKVGVQIIQSAKGGGDDEKERVC